MSDHLNDRPITPFEDVSACPYCRQPAGHRCRTDRGYITIDPHLRRIQRGSADLFGEIVRDVLKLRDALSLKLPRHWPEWVDQAQKALFETEKYERYR